MSEEAAIKYGIWLMGCKLLRLSLTGASKAMGDAHFDDYLATTQILMLIVRF
jgi:hypothetical protein